MDKDQTSVELVKWLKSEKYLIDETSTTATEEFEKKHQWELSRNMMINKTIKKVLELSFN